MISDDGRVYGDRNRTVKSKVYGSMSGWGVSRMAALGKPFTSHCREESIS